MEIEMPATAANTTFAPATAPAPNFTPIDPLPREYAMEAHGDCMLPLFKSGAYIIASSEAAHDAGDPVIVHIFPEYAGRYGFSALVKRLVFRCNTQFPWVDNGSDIMPTLVVEMLNPKRRMYIPFDHIRAVHKVIGEGWIGEGGRCFTSALQAEHA